MKGALIPARDARNAKKINWRDAIPRSRLWPNLHFTPRPFFAAGMQLQTIENARFGR